MGGKSAGQQQSTTNNTPWGPAQPYLQQGMGLANQWLYGGAVPTGQSVGTSTASLPQTPTQTTMKYGGIGQFGSPDSEGPSSWTNPLIPQTPGGPLGVQSSPVTQTPSAFPADYNTMANAAKSNVAGLPPALQQAYLMQAQQALGGTPWMGIANNAYNQMLSGAYQNDPNYQFQANQLGRTFQDITMPALAAQFGGRAGNSAQALAYGQNANELGNALAGLSAGVYNANANRQLQAMQLAPTMQQLPYYDINQLGAVGEQQRQYQQQLLNAPLQQLQTYNQLLSPGLGFNTGSTSQPLYKNPLSGGLGGAATGAYIGSIVPGLGTGLGAGLGGALGLLGSM